jgi:hypothetical protein
MLAAACSGGVTSGWLCELPVGSARYDYGDSARGSQPILSAQATSTAGQSAGLDAPTNLFIVAMSRSLIKTIFFGQSAVRQTEVNAGLLQRSAGYTITFAPFPVPSPTPSGAIPQPTDR